MLKCLLSSEFRFLDDEISIFLCKNKANKKSKFQKNLNPKL